MNTNTLPANISDLVRDRIKSEFSSLVPEEYWRSLVDDVLKSLVTPQRRSNGIGGTRVTSDLQEIVRESLVDQFKTLVNAELNDPKYKDVYNGYRGCVASEVIQDLVADHGQALFQGLIAQMVSQCVSYMSRQN